MNSGFDQWWWATSLPCWPGCCMTSANGVYCGDHNVHTIDHPSLGRTNDPAWSVEYAASRTSAHEIGHGLNLDHYNGFPDSNDCLMSSGRKGFKLQDFEIQIARTRAAQKALPDTTPKYCAPARLTP
jgi:hypothetical protein